MARVEAAAAALQPLMMMISLNIVILIVSIMPWTVSGETSVPAGAEAEEYLLKLCKKTSNDNDTVMKYCFEPLKPYTAVPKPDPYSNEEPRVWISTLAWRSVRQAMGVVQKAMNETQGGLVLKEENKTCIDFFYSQNKTLTPFLDYIGMPVPDAGDLSPEFELRVVTPWRKQQCEQKFVTPSFRKAAKDYGKAIHVSYVLIELSWALKTQALIDLK